jgi:hypothetical protein
MLKNLKGRKETSLCKFTSQEIIPKNIKVGSKILFYYSGKILGESRVKKISLVNSKEISKKNKEDLLISLEEFNEYIAGRINKRILYIKIHKIKMYKKKVNPLYPVTMNGRYIREKEYSLWRA